MAPGARFDTLFVAVAAILSFVTMEPVAAQVPFLSPRYGEAPAPSVLTVRLFAEAHPIVAFLDQSSDLALTRAAAPGLRTFARREALQQAVFAALLQSLEPQDASGLDPLGTAAKAANLIDRGAQRLLSGLPPLLRTPGAEAVAIERANAGLGARTLRDMGNLSGPDFDALYVTVQEDGLRQLASLYRLYIQNGDEQPLRALVVHELPRVQARIAELKRFPREVFAR